MYVFPQEGVHGIYSIYAGGSGKNKYIFISYYSFTYRRKQTFLTTVRKFISKFDNVD